MLAPRWRKQLDARAFLVFQRLRRFYSTFIVLAVLISGLSLAALTFDEFHPSPSALIRSAEGFLCSSAITAVVSAVLATMLLFRFEGMEDATRGDVAIAWSPLILLDVSILEFLVGVVCWYCGKSARWRAALIITQLMLLLGGCVIVCIWMWFNMKEKGGMGKEDAELPATKKRVAQ
ncbi:hypothetical protein BDW62DRAFT_172860 [Aspergillus aurantiobrunneus]